jgi:hypothetical protein
MSKSKNVNWKDNQNECLTFLKNKLNLKDDEIICIDSKIADGDIRNLLNEQFLFNIKEIMPNSNKSSSLKGDFIIIKNNKIFIVEVKNYTKARGNMHLPKIYDITTFIKTIDSNIKYPLFYYLNTLDVIFQDLYNRILTKELDPIFNEYSTPKVVATITIEQMETIINSLEIGYAFNQNAKIGEASYEISKTKFFIQRDKNQFIFKKLDFSEITSNTKIKIELYVCPKKYTYISFLMDEITNGVESTFCIYSMSMRDITERKIGKNGKPIKVNIANCSFTHSKFLKIIDVSSENLLELLK